MTGEGGPGPPPFARLLARHRRATGLTQEELAEKSGISARAISDMERGKVRRPQHRTLQALATALAVGEPELAQFLGTAGYRQTPALPRAAEPPAVDRPLHELPPEVADLAGREHEALRLLDMVDAAEPDAHRTATVISLYGAPGVGKTTFAVHVGHRLVERYPDGCLFVNLRGMDPDRLTAEQALRRMLIALGVPEARLPAGLDECSGLYRSLLRDRRMLLLLDNAADEAQVRPLLPSSPGSLVLITSRRVLSGLESVARIPLEVLRPEMSARLLASIIGPQRVAAEPEAAARVAELCGHLPLALRIAGNRLATRPRWRIENLVRQLGDQQRRLTVLTAGDLQVRSAFEVSYRQCGEQARAVFRRLALITGPDVTVDLAAVLSESDRDAAECALEELVDASLLDSTTAPGRCVLHDLMRSFAWERLMVEEAPAGVREAEARMTAWLLRVGTQAGRMLCPPGSGQGPPADPDGVVATREEAVRWLDSEKPRWVAAVRHAVRTGDHEAVLAFSQAMHWYSDIRVDGPLWRELFTHGVEAARALGRRREEAVQLNFLGWALNQARGTHREALRVHEHAWQVAREVGDRSEEAWALQYCGRTELVQGKAAECAEYVRPAISLFQELGDPLGANIALSTLGMALHQLGDFEESIAAHRRSVEYFRTPEMKPHENLLTITLLRLADAMEAADDIPGAHRTYQESLTLATRVGYPFVEGLALFGSGRCERRLGEWTQARRHFESALTVLIETDELWNQAKVRHELATLDEDLDPSRAQDHREHALGICHRLDTPEARDLARELTAELESGARKDPRPRFRRIV